MVWERSAIDDEPAEDGLAATLKAPGFVGPGRAALEWLRERLGADGALYLRFVASAEGARFASVLTVGPTLAPLEQLDGRLADGLSDALHPRQTAEPLRNRLRLWSEDRGVVGNASAFHREQLGPLGFSDQVRMTAYVGDRHVGYVSALYFGGGGLEVARWPRVRELEASVREALIELHRRATRLPHPKYVVLATTGGVLHHDGAVDGEARSVLSWLGAVVRDLGPARTEPSRAWWAGLEAEVTPLRGDRGPTYLARLERLPDVRLDPFERLTDRQRAVAVRAAGPGNLPEIAAELGVSPNTVKTHLRRVYEVLGVKSRPELARVLECRRS